MLVSSLIAYPLVEADFSVYFSKLPGAIECAEPVVLVEGAFERESRIEGEERSTVDVTCYVVREVSAEAEAAALECERVVRNSDWELHRDASPWRIAGVDTTAPFLKERDSSGRYVWQFGIEVTAVREI